MLLRWVVMSAVCSSLLLCSCDALCINDCSNATLRRRYHVARREDVSVHARMCRCMAVVCITECQDCHMLTPMQHAGAPIGGSLWPGCTTSSHSVELCNCADERCKRLHRTHKLV